MIWGQKIQCSANTVIRAGIARFPTAKAVSLSVVTHCVILYIHMGCDKYTHIYIRIHVYILYMYIIFHSLQCAFSCGPARHFKSSLKLKQSALLRLIIIFIRKIYEIALTSQFWSVMSLVSQSWHKGLSLLKVEKSTQKYCKYYCKYLWSYLYSTGIVTFWSTFLS